MRGAKYALVSEREGKGLRWYASSSPVMEQKITQYRRVQILEEYMPCGFKYCYENVDGDTTDKRNTK
jgi:hypothetical protein